MYARRYQVVFLVCVLLTIACGRKGNPRPPEATAPVAVRYFQVIGHLDFVELRWEAPEKTASGDALIDLEGFVVKKSLYEQGARADFDELDRVLVKDPRNDEVEESKMQKGPKEYSYVDHEVKAGEQYEYMVVPINTRGVEGMADTVLRVHFVGEATMAESFLPRDRM